MTIYDKEAQLGIQLLTDVIERLKSQEPIMLDTSLRQVLAGMAGTSLNRLGAIRELVNIDAMPEAAILVRSMIELQISAAHIVFADESGREIRARRFLAFETRQRTELVNRVLEEAPGVNMFEMGSVGEQRLNELRQLFADACQEFDQLEKSTKWSGLSYARMIQSVMDTNIQAELLFVYKQVYFVFSDYAHPTPTGLRHVLPNAETPAQRPIMLPYAVPIFASMAATQLCGYAALEAGHQFRDTSDLIMQFVKASPMHSKGESGQRVT